MSVEQEVKQKMEASLEALRTDYVNLRSGRANPQMLDVVVVEVYGSEMKIRDLANVSVSEGRQLVITPYDGSTAGPIAKGVEKANLNLQPILEGNIVRIPIPPMSEEMRKDIVKQAKKRAEDAKIAIRDARRKGNDQAKKLKSDGELTEDEEKGLEKKIQTHTDAFCKQVDDLYAEKEKDILTV